MRPDQCDECGVTGVKLWREYGVYSQRPAILCVVHACATKGISPETIDAKGLHVASDRQPSDQIGWYVPAVPDGDGNWWGYTSIPDDAYEHWANLPTGPSLV